MSSEDREADALRVVEVLRADGRISLKDLADRLELPSKRVRSLVDELIESERIVIAPILDPAIMGYAAVALIELEFVGQRSARELMEELVTLPEADYVALSIGSTNAFVNVISRDALSLGRLIDERVRAISGVRVISTAPYLRFPYQRYGRSIDSSRSSTLGAYELDEFEVSAIRLLAQDGRMSNSEIARQLLVSETYVRKRLRRLMDEGVLRVAAITKHRTADLEPTALVKLKVSGGFDQVVEQLRRVEAVTFIAEVLSDFDYLVELTGGDMREIAVAIGELRDTEGISVVNCHLCYDVRYKPMLPRVAD